MTHETRPAFVRPDTPKGKSPQRVIQRPRIPDPTWTRALTEAHRQGRPIGHILTELLDEWLDRPDRPTDQNPGPSTDRTEDN